jgi:hypothetical protein
MHVAFAVFSQLKRDVAVRKNISFDFENRNQNS